MSTQRSITQIVCILVILNMSLPSVAAGQSESSSKCKRFEENRSQEVEEILRTNPLYQSIGPRTQKNAEFCNAFIDALRSSRRIEYIEPTYCVDDANESRLDRINGCIRYEQPNDRPFRNRFYDVAELGDRNIEVYELKDLGRLVTIYAEFDEDRPAANEFPGYSIVDPGSCERTGFVPAPYNQWTIRGPKKHEPSGLIRYLEELYVFAFTANRDAKGMNPHYYLTLYRKDDMNDFDIHCLWSWTPSR